MLRHEPLDHSIESIRVLQILPELTVQGMIQCLISHVTTEFPYSCLSYVWGESEPCQSIMVDGKPYIVRQNLFDFCEDVRSMTEITTQCWWIDIICIDQQNTAERNHQVQQMGRICSKAECVYIWLGKLRWMRLYKTLRNLIDPPRMSFTSCLRLSSSRTVCVTYTRTTMHPLDRPKHTVFSLAIDRVWRSVPW
jgi:hypothetical protein